LIKKTEICNKKKRRKIGEETILKEIILNYMEVKKQGCPGNKKKWQEKRGVWKSRRKGEKRDD